MQLETIFDGPPSTSKQLWQQHRRIKTGLEKSRKYQLISVDRKYVPTPRQVLRQITDMDHYTFCEIEKFHFFKDI